MKKRLILAVLIFAAYGLVISENLLWAQTEKTVLHDLMNSETFTNLADSDPNDGYNVTRTKEGGSFETQGIQGWRPSPVAKNTDIADLVVYDLGRYIEEGSLEIDVTKFNPVIQSSEGRHHVLAMFRTPWAGHHVVEQQETFWDLHTGLYYSNGNNVKFLSNTYYSGDESPSVVPSNWSMGQTYRLKISWSPSSVTYYRDGISQVQNPLFNPMELRYIYVGRDRTVAGDIELPGTGFMKNQYPTMHDLDGPIYSNLVVKEIVSATDVTPPVIDALIGAEVYANGARLNWDTVESNVVCYVEYGTMPGSYTLRWPATGVLEPPRSTADAFTTALPNLSPNQTYYYRIAGADNVGNLGYDEGQFTTASGEKYVFKPSADTYIENNVYGDVRTPANFG